MRPRSPTLGLHERAKPRTEPATASSTVHDPEHDPPASYALEPDYVASLTRQIVATLGREQADALADQRAAARARAAVDDDDVAEAFARARKAQGSWARTPVADRAAVLLRFHDLVLDRQDEILDLIQWESGKARKHAFDEVVPRRADRPLLRAARPTSTSTRSGRSASSPALTRVELNHVPKGVVGIISPWNYPFTMALCDGLPALLAGNAVVAKPDSQTMLTALLGAGAARRGRAARRTSGRSSPGPGPVSAPRSSSTPTTSASPARPATGRIVAQQCAERLIGCSLELGGKNPMLVLRDADLDRAAEGAVRACFSYAGQLCVSIERMYVADQVYDQFIERFVARTKAMTLGAVPRVRRRHGLADLAASSSRPSPRTSRTPSPRAPRVLTGGRARPDLGPFFYEPTILEGVTPRHDVLRRTRPSARSSRSTGSTTRARRWRAPTTASTASTPRSAPRTAPRARAVAAPDQVRHGQHQRGVTAPPSAASTRRWAACAQSGLGRRQGAEGIHALHRGADRGHAAAAAARAVLGMSDERYAKVMTARPAR